MEYVNYWPYEIALENCLCDPRLDAYLRAHINNYLVDFYLPQKKLEEVFALNDKDDIEDNMIIVFHHTELPGKTTISLISTGETEHEKLVNKNNIISIRDTYEKLIKATIEEAIKNNLEASFEKIPEYLRQHAINYYKSIVKDCEYRANKLIESFSEKSINDNHFILEEEKIYRSHEVTEVVNDFPSFESKYIRIQPDAGAYLTTLIGRDKPLPYITRQEDQGDVIANVKLHPSWENRIPELLALITQKLASKIYKKFPRYNPSNPNQAQKDCCSSGTTFTLAFTHATENETTAYVLCMGDSPAASFKINKETNKTEISLLTWSHNPGTQSQGNLFEKKRVEEEKGKIVADKTGKMRVVNPFGGLRVSRSIGDRGGPGISDIGSIYKKILPNDSSSETFLLLGSDGLFDFLPLKRMEELSQCIKIENLAECLCIESYRNLKNHDNITGIILPTGHNVFTYIADGHGNDYIPKYIRKELPQLIKKIAEETAPAPTVAQNLENSQKMKKRKASSQSETSTATDKSSKLEKYPFFAKSEQTKTKYPQYDRTNIVHKIESLPFFYPQNKMSLKKGSTEEIKDPLFLRRNNKLSDGLYTIYTKKTDVKEDSSFYIPAIFPMSYDEYKSIPPQTRIMSNEMQLDDLLSSLDKKNDLDEENTDEMNMQ